MKKEKKEREKDKGDKKWPEQYLIRGLKYDFEHIELKSLP